MQMNTKKDQKKAMQLTNLKATKACRSSATYFVLVRYDNNIIKTLIIKPKPIEV